MFEETKLELVKIPLSRLLKLELPQFAERVIGLIEKHNPEELQINEVFGLLKQEKPKIAQLVVRHGPHPITDELGKLREMRRLYVSGILYQLKVVMKEDKTGADSSVKLVKIEVQRFLDKLSLSRNDETINRKITQFYAEIEQSQVLEVAFDSLGFTDILDELQSIHSTIEELRDVRLVAISERPKVKTPALSKSVREALKVMFKEIEVAPIRNPEIDYEPLFDQLNGLLIEYRNLINNRVLFNKRKAEELENNEAGDSDEPQDAPETTTHVEPVREMMRLTMGDESMNGHNVPLEEQQQAVATSAKPKQPHSVNNKG